MNSSNMAWYACILHMKKGLHQYSYVFANIAHFILLQIQLEVPHHASNEPTSDVCEPK